ncbi:hypothetical protein P154DRAFT_195856 [Amniculicola lignicola CBS 123094]|uniref:Heterokaryon incompatibility domain-containing protein n=1 Tax=Amniculicola lignicola CBS 123094 TaxID=1392246 RepID=A0A6A5WN51_9PLEO|nr:hypothetical protein P154DRAFT_195856 [Amniculicola lignicola CBS 123094]
MLGSLGAESNAAAETEAFEQTISNVKAYVPGPTRRAWPKRLLNIHTGKLEPGDSDKQYAIVSYIWDPPSLPEYPRKERREDLDDSWEYTTDDFDDVLALATSYTGDEDDGYHPVRIDTEFHVKAARLPHPDIVHAKSELQADYFREVCSLASVEALDQGLDYIWMDSICIDQADPKDVAEQIPNMADYYTFAQMCVVVSEMLRRGLAHRRDRLGSDVLNSGYIPPWDAAVPDRRAREATFLNSRSYKRPHPSLRSGGDKDYHILRGIAPSIGIVAGRTFEERIYRAKFGLLEEITGWCVLFHEQRVWTFQEMSLSTHVVHRGQNVRIDTSSICKLPASASSSIHSTVAYYTPMEYMFDHDKRNHLNVLQRWSFMFLRERLPLFSLPSWNSATAKGIFPTEARYECLSIMRSQGRSSLFEQDLIYGVLAFFPPTVRQHLPKRYDISLSAIFAMLVYAVIQNDPGALHFNENYDYPQHNIIDFPSWLPNRYGSFTRNEVCVTPREVRIKVEGRQLLLTAPYFPIRSFHRPIPDSEYFNLYVFEPGEDGKELGTRNLRDRIDCKPGLGSHRRVAYPQSTEDAQRVGKEITDAINENNLVLVPFAQEQDDDGIKEGYTIYLCLVLRFVKETGSWRKVEEMDMWLDFGEVRTVYRDFVIE